MSLSDLAHLVQPLAWREQAACRNLSSEYFFWGNGTDRGGAIPDAVKNVALDACGSCLVRQECLDHAIANWEPAGIWGGLTVKERQAYKRRRAG